MNSPLNKQGPKSDLVTEIATLGTFTSPSIKELTLYPYAGKEEERIQI